MKNKILTFSFLIITLFLPLLAQYEWSEPFMLAPKVPWPDAGYGPTAITMDNEGVIHAFWTKVFDRYDANYEQIFYRKSEDGGVNWTETENLTPDYYDHGYIIGDLNAVCDSTNTVHLLFGRGEVGVDIMYMIHKPESTWSKPERICNYYAVAGLKAAIDHNDRIYATWYNGSSTRFTYNENGSWQEPVVIFSEQGIAIYDLKIDGNNDLYVCGRSDKPVLCKYNRSAEIWDHYEEIPGFTSGFANALTFTSNDTINVNVLVGPYDFENNNYNVRKKKGETFWTSPEFVNENSAPQGKDFYSDKNDGLHLFERSTDDSSLVYVENTTGEWIEKIIHHEIDHTFWEQNVFFDGYDQFYMIYDKLYYETNERAIFFQKKQIEVGIENNDEVIVKDCKLHQNYPNPFNSVSVIEYSIDKPSNIKLSVYNLKGELVNNLLNKKQDTGKYSVRFEADDLSSGVYYYRLEVDGIVKDTKKMLYLR